MQYDEPKTSNIPTANNPPSRLHGLCNRADDNLSTIHRLNDLLQQVISKAEGEQGAMTSNESDKAEPAGLLGRLGGTVDSTNALLQDMEQRIEYLNSLV